MKMFNLRNWMMVLLIIIFCYSPVNAASRLSVKAGIANMRSGPGTKYEVLWQVEKFHPFMLVEKKGKWLRVKDFEGDSAWLHNSLVGKTPTVITTRGDCNVRSKPSTKGQIVFTVEKGVPFRVVKRKGNWIRIEHADGEIGWIYKKLVW